MSDALLNSPWWISAIGAAGSYLIFYAILPSIFAANPFLVGIAMVSRGLAWLPAVAFAFLAVLSYFRERRERRERSEQVDAQPGSARKASNSDARRLRKANASPPPVSGGPDSDATLSAPDADMGSPSPAAVQGWSLEALSQLEWKRFELLCVLYYEQMGFTVKTVPHGPDGGIDATLYKAGLEAPVAVVQCKAWRKPVKVDEVRALGGVMLANKVRRGVFWSLSGYVGAPVQAYAPDAGIQLLDGPAILERIRALDRHKQDALLAQVFQGDYRTPSCPACGVKLVARKGKSGPFWGCLNFPACRYTLQMGRVG